MNNLSTEVNLIGHNAWIVAMYLISVASLVVILLTTSNIIIQYICMAMVVGCILSSLYVLFVIGRRENKVNPNLTYRVNSPLKVKEAMTQQKEATKNWSDK